MDKIEKDHSKDTIMKLGDDNIEDVSVIPSGSIGLNAALGVGGYPNDFADIDQRMQRIHKMADGIIREL